MPPRASIVSTYLILSLYSPVQESAETGIEAYARPASVGVTGGSGGRHLGPTYDEVLEISRKSRVSAPAVAPAGGPAKIGKVLSASGKFDLVPGGPSREQVHALLNLGVTDMPATKEEAVELIRELRDMQIAQRFGMQEMKKDGAPAPEHVPDWTLQHNKGLGASTSPAAPPTSSHGPEEHLKMAMQGISIITRRT